MKIFVKTLAGSILTLDVDPTWRMFPDVSFAYREVVGEALLVSAKSILGGASGALSVVGASAIADFWSSIEGADVRKHLVNKLYGGVVARMGEDLLEFSRFMLMKALWHDTAPPALSPRVPPAVTRSSGEFCRFSPPGIVDQIWHEFMLFPVHYGRFCAAILGDGELFDHDPRAARMGSEERARRYSATFSAYRKVFREKPLRSCWEFPWDEEAVPGLRSKAMNTLAGRIWITQGIPPDQQRLIFDGRQ